MTFFFLINFTALLSYAYPSDFAIITLKLKWAAKICGPLKWATARKRLRNTDLSSKGRSVFIFQEFCIVLI